MRVLLVSNHIDPKRRIKYNNHLFSFSQKMLSALGYVCLINADIKELKL